MTFPLRSRGTLDIERFKNIVSLTLETAEEKLRTSWYSRVLELFTGDQRMVRGRLGVGFHDSISTLLANQVSITRGPFSLSLYLLPPHSFAPCSVQQWRTTRLSSPPKTPPNSPSSNCSCASTKMPYNSSRLWKILRQL